jgi:hypothetical protein
MINTEIVPTAAEILTTKATCTRSNSKTNQLQNKYTKNIGTRRPQK